MNGRLSSFASWASCPCQPSMPASRRSVVPVILKRERGARSRSGIPSLARRVSVEGYSRHAMLGHPRLGPVPWCCLAAQQRARVVMQVVMHSTGQFLARIQEILEFAGYFVMQVVMQVVMQGV